ncbi:mannosyltransferase putative-domain-containing protein [Chytriomyces sp. MP71]|nr:mannosyltransferase putative-domain-containing protein [Chytriomyces sp. MP71]
MKACPPQSDKSGACPAETHFAFSSPTIDKSLVPRKYLIESFIFDLEFMFSSPVMPTSARIIRRAIQLIAVVAAIVGFLTLVLQTDTGHRSLDAEARRHQAAWVKLERSIPRYEPLPSHVIKGSRGVLLMGTSNTISLVLTTVELLRKTGCKLPVEFAYLPNEVSENDLERLRANDIKPRNYSNAQISSQNWSHEHLRLGVLKPFAVMSSPLQEVLFLDPDVIPLRDPTYLFATNKYREFGALFWPDFPATPRSNPIWRIMKQPYVFEREFETGIMVLDKARVGRPLVLAAHLCENAGYYFRYIWGDKDAFRWAFKVAKIPYYLNPNYLMSVGLLVSEQNPRGNVSLVETDGKLSPPEGAGYCGQNMVQMDFDDKFPMSSTFKPQPLFVHANGIKKNYYDDIPPFQVAQIYTGLPKRATLNSLRRGRYEWIGQFHEQDHCGKLAAQEGLAVSYLENCRFREAVSGNQRKIYVCPKNPYSEGLTRAKNSRLNHPRIGTKGYT